MNGKKERRGEVTESRVVRGWMVNKGEEECDDQDIWKRGHAGVRFKGYWIVT